MVLSLQLAVAAAAHSLAPATLPSAVAAIERANADWARAMQTGDADLAAAPYDDDSAFVLPDGSTITGRAGVAELYRRRFSAGGTILHAAISSFGRVPLGDGRVLEWGQGDVVARDKTGAEVKSSGRYVTVWKQRDDGSWAIVRNMSF